ncbi:toxin-antitoxin system YwqK family antitoxin [Ekhidna sp.]|uniref:toxin-antitoxin system YwqK family antitoxin n=1 Tax=Ekhidna sp. TaxID=2608089 RepID=UPI00351779A2
MKRISQVGLLLLVIWGCSKSKEGVVEAVLEMHEIPEVSVSISDERIKKRQSGEVYFNNLPFSGYLIERYSNDTIARKTGYFEGKQNGMTTAYYPDGSIQYQRPYLNGEKHGIHIGFHKNGVKAYEYYFVNGFNEGNHKEWFETGALAADMNYVDGKEFGRQQVWRPDGKVRSNYIVRENGRRYGLMGIKRCTKLDGVTQTVDPYKGTEK